MGDLLRLLLVSALAWALVGCSSASQQTHRRFEYASRGLYRTHYVQSSQVHSKLKTNAPHRKKHNYSSKIAESQVVPKMGAPSFVRPNDNTAATTSTGATKSEVPPSTQPDDEAKKTEMPHDQATKLEIPPSTQPDDEAKKTEMPHDQATKLENPPSSQLDDESVIKKAKATIAAKMTDPDSVEFEQMERAARKNALGNSIDTICGVVSDKNSGPKPFLYLVQKDEAYIGGYVIATSEYRDICSATLPGR
jgi:hypothetical protein